MYDRVRAYDCSADVVPGKPSVEQIGTRFATRGFRVVRLPMLRQFSHRFPSTVLPRPFEKLSSLSTVITYANVVVHQSSGDTATGGGGLAAKVLSAPLTAFVAVGLVGKDPEFSHYRRSVLNNHSIGSHPILIDSHFHPKAFLEVDQ